MISCQRASLRFGDGDEATGAESFLAHLQDNPRLPALVLRRFRHSPGARDFLGGGVFGESRALDQRLDDRGDARIVEGVDLIGLELGRRWAIDDEVGDRAAAVGTRVVRAREGVDLGLRRGRDHAQAPGEIGVERPVAERELRLVARVEEESAPAIDVSHEHDHAQASLHVLRAERAAFALEHGRERALRPRECKGSSATTSKAIPSLLAEARAPTRSSEVAEPRRDRDRRGRALAREPRGNASDDGRIRLPPKTQERARRGRFCRRNRALRVTRAWNSSSSSGSSRARLPALRSLSTISTASSRNARQRRQQTAPMRPEDEAPAVEDQLVLGSHGVRVDERAAEPPRVGSRSSAIPCR